MIKEEIKKTILDYVDYTFDVKSFNQTWISDYILELRDKNNSKINLLCLEPNKIDIYINDNFYETLMKSKNMWYSIKKMNR